MEQQEQQSGPPLCLKGCGFFGNPATGNMCSKCHKAMAKDQAMADQAMAAPSAPAATAQASRPIDVPAPPAAAAAAAQVAASPDATGLSPPCGSGRCFACNKKTGLTGFKCRCGQSFCGSHRYADAHACSFDYKAAAAQQLAKANPVVAASKIDKF